MITVHDIHKAYGAKTVLNNVNACFPRGGLTSLIGPNGAGKTTLLMMIARLMAPGRGEVRLEGRPITGLPINEYAKRVATLRQSPDFNLRLTVEELIAFGRFPFSRGALTAEDRRLIGEAIEFLSQANHYQELSEMAPTVHFDVDYRDSEARHIDVIKDHLLTLGQIFDKQALAR